MLGVVFVDGPESIAPGESGEVHVECIYDLSYDELRPGAGFAIVEGARRIGTGVVLRVVEPIALREPWTAVTKAAGEELEKELRREVSAGHPLRGLSMRAVARRTDRDDVLFEVADSGECVVVHLTWARRGEPPPFPEARRFASLAAWASTAMAADAEDFKSG
jgi:hypothetical protein